MPDIDVASMMADFKRKGKASTVAVASTAEDEVKVAAEATEATGHEVVPAAELSALSMEEAEEALLKQFVAEMEPAEESTYNEPAEEEAEASFEAPTEEAPANEDTFAEEVSPEESFAALKEAAFREAGIEERCADCPNEVCTCKDAPHLSEESINNIMTAVKPFNPETASTDEIVVFCCEHAVELVRELRDEIKLKVKAELKARGLINLEEQIATLTGIYGDVCASVFRDRLNLLECMDNSTYSENDIHDIGVLRNLLSCYEE